MTTTFHSTRSTTDSLTAKQAIRKGIADDGGLFVSDALGKTKVDVASLPGKSYQQIAAEVLGALLPDFTAEELGQCIADAYGEQWSDERITPLKPLGDDYVLELFNGPTSAFKDVALQILPRFMAHTTPADGDADEKIMILTATSGDTGKAALEGFKGVDGVSIGVLFPDGGVSDIQRKQMVTTTGDNVQVWAVRGNFDDCQTGVKHAFADEKFAEKLLDEYRIALSSANSINWGRLLPQVVYYISSYAELVAAGKIEAGCPIDVCVPTGNFGNILAAWYAKQIGVPIERLLCASNDNRVLTDFINTGTYDISDREFILTSSPSMDILVSSNLERQLFELTGRNGEAIRQWMADLADARCFRVDAETFRRVRENFSADSVDNATCLATIREVLDAHDYLLDPHTAVAYAAAQNLRGENPVLIASTAHWAKFGNNVYRAIHGIEPSGELPADVAALTGCELNKLIAEETGKHHIPAGLANLDTMQVRFTEVIDNDVEAIEDAAEAFLTR